MLLCRAGPCHAGRAVLDNPVPCRAEKLRAGRAVPCRGHPVMIYLVPDLVYELHLCDIYVLCWNYLINLIDLITQKQKQKQ